MGGFLPIPQTMDDALDRQTERSGAARAAAGPLATRFNIYWTGPAANLYIDTSEVSAITGSSDDRVKQK
jgi:hypothetical protein